MARVRPSTRAKVGRAGTPPISAAASQGAKGSVEAGLSDGRLSALERRVQELETSARGVQENGVEARGDRERPTVADPPFQRLDPAEQAALNDRKIAYREEMLRAEASDPEWSLQTEDQLAKAFDGGTYQGSALRRTHCGTTFCVMVVRHDDMAARMDFERLIDAVYMSGEFVVRTSADGALETTAYFIRQDKDSPDHPVRRKL